MYLANGEFLYESGTVEYNTADEIGGGIYIDSGKVSIGTDTCKSDESDHDHPIVRGNKAKNGGAIAVISNEKAEDSVKIHGGLFTENVAAGGDDDGKGGGLYIKNGNLEMHSGHFVGDEDESLVTANYGGAAYIEGGDLKVTGGEFRNERVSQDGGAIYVDGGNVNIENATISNCRATSGGGIYVYHGSFSFTNGDVHSNKAKDKGGGICVIGGDVTIDGGNIGGESYDEGNVADYGGGLYIYNGDVTMNSGNIDYNTANESGGGLFINDDTENELTTIHIKEGSISYNFSNGHAGAMGVEAEDSSLVDIKIGIEDCCGTDEKHSHPIISSNHAYSGSGGICTHVVDETKATVTMYLYCGQVIHNISTTDEGGRNVYQTGGSVYIYGSYLGTENKDDKGVIVTSGSMIDLGEPTKPDEDWEPKDDTITIYYIIKWDIENPFDESQWEYDIAYVTAGLHLNMPTYTDSDGRIVVAWRPASPYSDKHILVSDWFKTNDQSTTPSETSYYFAVYEFEGHGVEEATVASPGKEYESDKLEKTSKISISGNSSFTVAFSVCEMDVAYYGERRLKFGKAPASGTTITMIVRMDDEPQSYYYYVVDGSEAIESGNTIIPLTAFKAMGSNEYFEPLKTLPDGKTSVDEEFTFIIDFEPQNLMDSVQNYMILERKSEDATKDSAVQTIHYTLQPERVFSIEANDSYIGEPFTIRCNSTAPIYEENAESYYQDKRFSLVLSGSELPQDAFLCYGDEKYYLNSNGQFIVNLENNAVDFTGMSAEFTLFSPSSSANEESFTLTAALWVSTNDQVENSMMGTQVAGTQITMLSTSLPAMKLSMEKRIFYIEELPASVTIDCQLENAEDKNIIWSISKKTCDGTYEITNEHAVSKGTINFGQATVGTYQIRCDLKEGESTILSDSYNFLIISKEG